MNLIHPKGPLVAHPLALIFPPMEDRDFKELLASVKDHGLREDIILLDGMVLDGIHRYKACMEAEIAPTFTPYSEDFDGKSPEEFVMDKNFTRRHLSLSQRAAISTAFLAAEEANAKKRQADSQFKKTPAAPAPATGAAGAAPEIVVEGKKPAAAAGAPEAPKQKAHVIKGKGGAAAEKIAEKFGVSKTMVKLAKRIKKADADLFAEVLNGTKTVNEAIVIIDAREADEKDTGKKLADKQARAKALQAIGDTYGLDSDVYRKAAGKEILKKPSDLIAFSLMKGNATKSIIPLLGMGWDLDKAKRYLDGKMTMENSLEDLANLATANGKPKEEPFVVIVGNWTITIAQASE